MTQQHFVYGLHAVKALLTHTPKMVKTLYIQSQRRDKRAEEMLTLAKKEHVFVSQVGKEKLDALVGNGTHQGLVAEVLSDQKRLNENDLYDLLNQLKTPPFLLVLDCIQDPHNLGACLRSADAAGVHAVIAPRDNSVGITPVVRKVASGAAETMPFIQVTNLSRTIEQLKERGIWIVGMAEEAESCLYQQELSGAIAMVVGQEGAGLRRLTKEACDFLVNIPMSGTVASLNVSVATGIALFEVVRQRSGNC